MTEHNHHRGTQGNKGKTRWRGWKRRKGKAPAPVSLLADRIITCKTTGYPDGPNDAARFNRGEKKFERTRFRFHENAATRKLAVNSDED